MFKVSVLVLLLCAGVLILALPVRRRIGHYFVFWKTSSQELLPNLSHLQHRTRELILHYFHEEYVNRTAGSEHTMDSAKDLYDRLNLTKFPSDRVLSRENRTNFIFIKGLLKESYRLCTAYEKILGVEREFRCDVAKVKTLCEDTRKIEKGLTDVTSTLESLLKDFFKARTLMGVTTRRERKVLAYFKKKRQTDENEMKLRNDMESEDDVYTTEAHFYRRRNRASVGLLYAVFVHLKDTAGTIEYALKLLEPPRDETA